MSDALYRWHSILDIASWLVLLLSIAATGWRIYGLLDLQQGGHGGAWAIEFGNTLLSFSLALLLFLGLRLLLLGVSAIGDLRDLSAARAEPEADEVPQPPTDGV